jgi:5-methylcytosine-specific restriction endonuclease McrA
VTEARLPRPEKRARKPRKPIRRKATLGAKRAAAKAFGWVDPDSWQAVLAFYRYGCAYCEADHWDQQDHCRPLSRGGRHDISNVVPSCAACNYGKGTTVYFPARRHPFMEKA